MVFKRLLGSMGVGLTIACLARTNCYLRSAIVTARQPS